ncbi:MAG: hypothetical protein M3256_09500 [Actinomycetota bacterium]|nr:hypothetical protein [Actinomycetota bacterium]
MSGQPRGLTTESVRIRAENALPGSSDWKLTDRAVNHEIEGYANRTSVDIGDRVTLYVSTIAPTFRVEAYRMGFYQGLGGRLVDTVPETIGSRQAPPSFTPGTNMIEAKWQPSLSMLTTGWPEGEYLFKLIASTGQQQYVPLTVRNDRGGAAYMIIDAVTTWQAYNLWGDYSLYAGKNGSFDQRSRVVSFDRPYLFGDGAANFLDLEYPAVSLMESLGLDVTYMTSVDVHEQPELLLSHRAVFSMGHDEYYSLAMRDGLQSARDKGVNLAFLGANAIYRHIRFGPSPLGPDRHEIDYKSTHEDPLYGKNNADVTVNWRDPPNSNPESQIIGNLYQCNPVKADMVIVDPSNWLFEGTGAFAGQRLPDVVASEYDRYDPSFAGPANVEILTHSPLRCHGKPDFADATYYTAPSGAGVFASGTISFVGYMNANCEPAGCAGRVLGRVMTNLLAAFGAGPAGLTHPSKPEQSTVQGRPPVNPTASTSVETLPGGAPSDQRATTVP